MSERKKKPGAAFWATVVVVALLVAYPLSFGPACWAAGENATALEIIPNVYYPILWLARTERPGGAGRIDRLIEWYSTLGRSDGAWPYLAPKGEKRWAVPPDP